MDKELINKMNKLIASKEGNIENNQEYEDNVDALNKTIELPELSYPEKKLAYDTFKAYNDRRLELEDKITKRLEKLNDDSSSQSNECNKFYSKQKIALNSALKQTNYKKEDILRENSVECPSNPVKGGGCDDDDDDNDDDDDEYYDYMN